MLTLLIISRGAAHLLLAFFAGWLIVRRRDGAARWSLALPMAALSLLIAGLIVTQIVAAAALAAPDDGCFAPGPLRQLALETWSGRVLAVRATILAVLALVLVVRRARHPARVMILAIASLFLVPFSGHAATLSPSWVWLVLHGVHVAASLAWIGGVMVLAVQAWEQDIAADLRAFSPVALRLVVLAAVTGVACGVAQVSRWPALFGSDYGQLLLLKALVLVGVALAAASWLRKRYLAEPATRSPRLALALEALAGVMMLGLAAWISQSVPGRHADIAWPLPFRFNTLLLWRDGALDWGTATQLALCGAALALAFVFFVLRQRSAAVILGGLGLVLGGIGLPAIITAAYPATYASSESAYAADNLFAAEQVYRAQCEDCHAISGHGDGPAMEIAGSAAADLTASHTGDHTPGDMFWWISNGRENSIMKGFADVTTPQDRWDLVNYVRLLALSARSKELGSEIKPLAPFLPSIDFAFSDAQGKPRSLRDFEGRVPVLLVLARENGSLARYREIETALGDFAQVNLQVVFVLGPETQELIPHDTPGLNLSIVREDVDTILASWSHYRRTPRNFDEHDHATNVGHMEFLIDRFGYVRARYRSDEGWMPSASTIIEQVKALAAEPQILPSPEVHVH